MARSNASSIDDLSTSWESIQDPLRFAFRYGPAIHAYLRRLLVDENDVDDVAQSFLVSWLGKKWDAADRPKNFRRYLKRSIRNAAMAHVRKKRLGPLPGSQQVTGPQQDPWDAIYSQTLLDRVWRSLERRQHSRRNNYCYSVLKIASEMPKAETAQKVDELFRMHGKRLSSAAFRKQLSRARRLFAQFLIDEVAVDIGCRDQAEIMDELRQLGLLPWVQTK